MNLEMLLKKHRKFYPHPEPDLIRRAYEFAEVAHQGEKRLNGEDFIKHPLGVANLLAEIRLGSSSLAAGLLHDVLEHTDFEKEDLEEEFPSPISDLVEGVTVIKSVKTKTGEERQVENLRKLILASAEDVRVVLIRLAEKLHNLETIKALPEEKQKVVLSKVFEIYAPLAERLGVYHFKWQLEDLAFRYLNPEEFLEIRRGVGESRVQREAYMGRVRAKIEDELSARGIKFEIKGRAKHLYSIFNKLRRYEREGKVFGIEGISRIYDQVALMILVDSISECYSVLSIVNSLWEPIPMEFDDYIAHPKPNGYRALHTTVLYEGRSLEIQIKTCQMHEIAEYGIAAHSYYKEKGNSRIVSEEKLTWLKDLIKWQEEIKNPREFEEALKLDVFGDRVFVLTPKGDVKDLPKGSTPIDFAYAVHSELGDSCVGAKVNGKVMSLDTKLENGQVVEILTSRARKKPSSDWLSFARTTFARSKIRKALRDFRENPKG